MKFGIFYELQLPHAWQNVFLLDLLNCGRCELGMGESASVTELTPFSRDMDT
jgi:hypothetical protein